MQNNTTGAYKIVLAIGGPGALSGVSTDDPMEAIRYARRDSEFGILVPDGRVISGYEGLHALESEAFWTTDVFA